MTSIIKIVGWASQLRETIGLDQTESIIDIIQVIEDEEYNYVEDYFDDDFSGFCCNFAPGRYIIGFNKNHHWNDGFKWFTLGHELAHVIIPHHVNVLHSGIRHVSRPEFRSQETMEREADLFAINFLAPLPAVRKLSISRDFNIQAV